MTQPEVQVEPEVPVTRWSLSVGFVTDPDLGEIDRSATGFPPGADFEATAHEPTVHVSHGAAGTLLHCALAGEAIDRRHDQPRQGSWYAFDPMAWTAQHPWRRVDLT